MVSPRSLILETSTRIAQAALAQGEAILGVRRLDETRRHARELAPSVRDLLAEQSWRPGDIDLMIVSKGPGSYTGLRVGIMSAKTFAYATGCALIAVETMSAVAYQSPAHVTNIDVFVDAQQDRVYVQRFSRKDEQEGFMPQTELKIVPFGDWLKDEAKSPWVSGPGLAGKERRLPEGLQMVEAALWLPQPESLLRLGLLRYRNGERDDVMALEPIYLRPSAAEEQWDRLGK